MRTLISIVVVILIFKWFVSEPKQEKIESAKIQKIEIVEFDSTIVCTKEGCKNVTMEDRRKAAEEAQRIIDEIMK